MPFTSRTQPAVISFSAVFKTWAPRIDDIGVRQRFSLAKAERRIIML